MSNKQNDVFNENVFEIKEGAYTHTYSDYCKCNECRDAREMSESDDYDLKTCHQV